MSILNRGHIYDSITRNSDKGSVPYRWTHSANDLYIGSGIFYYSIPYFLKAEVCVCLGSGGGFVPRLMVDCVHELNETNMYDEGVLGEVYIVDATNGVNGEVDWSDGDSFFRDKFSPKFLNSTTEDAFYNFFVNRDIKIDYLHIDAGHTYIDCKQDFDLYSTIMNQNGIISIHDTDENYWKNFKTYEDEPHDVCTGPSEVVDEIDNSKWEIFNLFDYKEKSSKTRSSGLTILRKSN